MFTLSLDEEEALARHRRETMEVEFVMQAVRDQGGASVATLDDAALEREVQATLDCCERLGLTSDADRLTLCLLEFLAVPGLRDLPQLPEIFAQAGGAPDARLHAVFAFLPFQVWAHLTEQAETVRRARGWT